MSEPVLALLKIKEFRWLALVAFILTGYDLIWDLMLSLLHSLMGLLHYLFELCEQGLDLLIEHLFHTSPRTTEIIVFYIMFSVIASIAYKLVKMLPRWYCEICNQIRNYWQEQTIRMAAQWRQQSMKAKTTWVSVVMASSFLLLMLTFS